MGDFVFLENNERIPADMIVIGTSNEDGRCYMETSTLDGEKNLKPREVIKKDFDYLVKAKMEDGKIEMIDVDVHMRICVKKPSYKLYEFDGYLEYYDKDTKIQNNDAVGLDTNNLLLKGAKLKNTQWVIAVAIYTGVETKIQLNATSAKSKMTKLEKRLHRVVLAIFCAQLAIGIFSGFGRDILLGTRSFELSSFLKFIGNPADTIGSYNTATSNLYDGVRYFLLMNTMIPISLIVTLEVVRLLQTIHMKMNYALRNHERDISCKVNTSSVNEELGEIEYILSDKTGTLTQNKMELKGIFIGDELFGGSFKESRYDADLMEFFSYKEEHENDVRPSERENVMFDPNLHKIIYSELPTRLSKPLVLLNDKMKNIDIETSEFKIPNPPNQEEFFKKAEESHGKLREVSEDSRERNFDSLRPTPARMYKKPNLSASHGNGSVAPEDFPTGNPQSNYFSFQEDQKIEVIKEKPEEDEEKIEVPASINHDERMKEEVKHIQIPIPPRDRDAAPKLNLDHSAENNSDMSFITKDSGLGFGKKKGYQLLPNIYEKNSSTVINTFQDLIAEFFMCSTLCNECIVDKSLDGEIHYLGPSPDEIAICRGSKEIGAVFLGSNTSGERNLNIFGEEKTVKVIMVKTSYLGISL